MSASITEKNLKDLRKGILKIDRKIINLISERMLLSKEIGKVKKSLCLDIENIEREEEVTKNAIAYGKSLKLKEKLIEELIKNLISSSKELQKSN